ncbi:predicted protein [Chaetomium globosum CBS 148.51]|uniref:Uncharacterized protein n=1 Tax=Chaetomium globosum (strain ATCC 6205 / CBS 148.51 / DSM 1962 / NBRC 6347 / NRRL 1970) TaxID=306901 RepID=Q2H285_CHAGB|nr:uncharacterized protein CHGG_04111 [Chaetomium globosum CBS 148.51]EAQ87492.1 predicted protein [Chaetomium globosum CBS 148.51]
MSNPTETIKQPAPGDAIADLAASLLSSPKHHHHHHHHPHPTATTTNNNPTATNQDTTAEDSGTERAMSHTGAWKPALDRRQSWSAQEYKHDLLKRQCMGGGAGKEGGGFSEVYVTFTGWSMDMKEHYGFQVKDREERAYNL